MLTALEDTIPALRRYAWSLLRNGPEADDLVQDTLLRALDRMDTRRPEGELRPWVFAIMHNLHVSRWRLRRRRVTVELGDQEAELAVPAPQPSQAQLAELLRGLDQLAPEHRQVLLLVAVEGFEYGEVAAILGVPVGTVMSRLSRARDKLHDVMEGRARPALRRVK